MMADFPFMAQYPGVSQKDGKLLYTASQQPLDSEILDMKKSIEGTSQGPERAYKEKILRLLEYMKSQSSCFYDENTGDFHKSPPKSIPKCASVWTQLFVMAGADGREYLAETRGLVPPSIPKKATDPPKEKGFNPWVAIGGIALGAYALFSMRRK